MTRGTVFDKQTLKNYAVTFLLILASAIVYHRVTNPLLLPKSSLIFLLFSAVGFRWILHMRRSFPQRAMRRFATLFGCACIWLCFLQSVKYAFSAGSADVQRYLWYLYYSSFLFAPVWMFLSMLHLGKPDEYCLSHKWNALYAPSAALFAAVLTNDLHQQAFRFPQGIGQWESSYTHGAVYYCVIAWIALLLTATFAVIIKSCLHRRLLRNLWLPVLVLLLASSYWINFTPAGDGPKMYLQSLFGVASYVGYCAFAFWESLRVSHIISSNTGYTEFFAASSLRAGLADETFTVTQVSADGLRPDAQTLRAASREALRLPDGDTVLKTRPVRGGWFFWTEDVGTLRRLNEELADTADYLAEKNAMLQQEAEMEENRRRTAHQTQLYNAVEQRVRPQLTALDRLLETAPEEEEAFRACMKRAALLFTFLKRCSNLLLLADEQPALPGTELLQCMEQSAIWLKELGAACEAEILPPVLPSQTAVEIYELFEAAAELPGLSALRLRLAKEGPRMLLTLRAACAEAFPNALLRRAEQLGQTETRRSGVEETLLVTLNEEVCAG